MTTKPTMKKSSEVGAGRRVKAGTPWGPATILEEVRLPQQVSGKRFAIVVQLLESGRGEQLVRLSYSTDGVVRRGPVTLRAHDLARLHAAVSTRPGLAQALELGLGQGPGGA
jgi:hypothetical protein